MESLNTAIMEAIRITEDEEFVEKNQESLRNSIAGVLEKVHNFTQWVGERTIKTAQALAPVVEKLGRAIASLYQENLSAEGDEDQIEKLLDEQSESLDNPNDK